ncbi:MAG: hypothetical protein ABIG68_14365, partial [Acidobacteriota bacterium]
MLRKADGENTQTQRLLDEGLRFCRRPAQHDGTVKNFPRGKGSTAKLFQSDSRLIIEGSCPANLGVVMNSRIGVHCFHNP